MQELKAKAESLVSRIRPGHLGIAFFAVAVAFLMLWSASRIKSVTVDVDGVQTVITTAITDPYKILESLDIEVEPKDKVSITGFETTGFFGKLGANKAEIRIQSAVNVNIVADELKYYITVTEGSTVADALEISGLTVREHDFLNVEETEKLDEGDNIKLTRVDYIITTEEETVQRGKTYRGTSLFTNNRKVLLSYGKNGTLLKTFQQKVVDGVYEERELVSEEMIKPVTDDVYLVGDGSVISPYDFGYEIVDGVPSDYVKVFENVRATGYHSPGGEITSTGVWSRVGYVAVDPKKIAYGSKLWIVAHGNTGFVYGYAVAMDTGGAMRSGKNFIDLYYDSYYECTVNGVRKVDVYVLEEPK